MKIFGPLNLICFLQALVITAANASTQMKIEGSSHDGTVSSCVGNYSVNHPTETIMNGKCLVKSGAGPITYNGLLYITIYTDDLIFPWVCSGQSIDIMSCQRTIGPSGS